MRSKKLLNLLFSIIYHPIYIVILLLTWPMDVSLTTIDFIFNSDITTRISNKLCGRK